MLRVAVLASGRGSNLGALLEAGRAPTAGYGIVGVFSDKPDAGALSIARDAAIPAIALAAQKGVERSAFDTAFFAKVQEVQPDLIVCAGYMRIISAAALAQVSPPMINIHPSLLPRHTGLDTHARALASGDSEHGASVHVVIPALDAGPVIAQVRVPVLPGDTEHTLHERIKPVERRLLIDVVRRIATGDIDLAATADAASN